MLKQTILFLFLKPFWGSQQRQAGWTLIEIGAVSVVVGILASLAFPSMMGIKSRMDTKADMSNLKQALQQVQRNAIKMGKECRVIMDTSSNPPRLYPDSATQYIGCLPFQEVSFSSSKFYENFSGTAIRFSYKGNSNNLGTMVLQSSVSLDTRYCLVLSNGIGMMRFGNYEEDPTFTVSHDYCKTGI